MLNIADDLCGSKGKQSHSRSRDVVKLLEKSLVTLISATAAATSCSGRILSNRTPDEEQFSLKTAPLNLAISA